MDPASLSREWEWEWQLCSDSTASMLDTDLVPDFLKGHIWVNSNVNDTLDKVPYCMSKKSYHLI